MIGRERRIKCVIGLRLVDDVLLEEGVMLGKIVVGESGSDLANALVLFVLRIVNAEQESSVTTRAFAFAEVSAHDYNVDSIADSVLLNKKRFKMNFNP